jgi:hypothetical protein
LTLLERALTDQIGVHLSIGDAPGGSLLSAFTPTAAESATLPAWALQNFAAQLESPGNTLGTPANITVVAHWLATQQPLDAASNLLNASQRSIDLTGSVF